MNLTELTRDLADGKATLEGINMRVIGMETRGKYWVKRITLASDHGDIYVLDGNSSGFEVYKEMRPEPVKRWRVDLKNSSLEISTCRVFDTEASALEFKNSLSSEWDSEIHSFETVVGPISMQPDSDKIPF